jgi:magnesium-transporting ATPase (P-type)
MSRLENFIARWLSLSGDTTFWSWIITFTYIAVIIMSFIYTRKIREEKSLHLLWMVISVFLLAMGINKQLDFQTLIIMSGKYIARESGLISYGRELERALAGAVSLVVLAIMIVIFSKTRKILKKAKTALTGVGLLLFFTFIRIGSITGIRSALILQYIISHIHALEFFGLLIILYSLINELLHLKKRAAADTGQAICSSSD